MSEEGTMDRAEELEYEISQLNRKKADVLDAFFSRQITKEEMQLVNQRYDKELETLQKRLEAAQSRGSVTYETEQLRDDVGRQVAKIVNGKADSEVLYKNVLDRMVVHKDRKVEVYLNLLPQKWTFVLENLRRSQNVSSVPTEEPKCTPLKPEKSGGCRGLPAGYLYTLPPQQIPFQKLQNSLGRHCCLPRLFCCHR